MQTHRIPYRSSWLSYTLYGSGHRLLICLHGYGESASSFAFLEEALGGDFTLLAIDMPFHGATEWKEGLVFDPTLLPPLIGKIASGLSNLENGWWLLGYSMGGRVALHLLQIMPEKIKRLVLLAPDGLKVNGWYWLATQTRLGNALFRWTMRQPGWFFFLLRTGNALKLVNPSVYKFTAYYIADDRVRQDLYIRWTTMRAFRPDLPVIKDLIRTQHLPVRLLYGRHDRIIRWENGRRFCLSIEPWCRLELLSSGHQLLQPAHLDAIIAALSDPPMQ
jgi:pimeloyl-ACP methyl ester carboxylesterase